MVKTKSLTICHLYDKEMNIYGDTGNVLALRWRLEQREFEAHIISCSVGEKLPDNVDIIVAGGGQDSGQFKVSKDLTIKSKTLQSMHRNGVVFLAICGMYQLFGNSFKTGEGEIKGVGIFDMYTEAGEDRLIGNVNSSSEIRGDFVGFENHSGRTFLRDTGQRLSTVTKGAGNNGHDATEGCVSLNAFGTYLHGPVLPKNPQLADELIQKAMTRKYGKGVQLAQLDDSFALKAAAVARKLPR